MIEKFGSVGFPMLGAIGTIWFLIKYIKSSQEGVAQPGSQFFKTATVYCETKSVKWDDANDSKFYENIFYLVVGNGIETGQLLKRSQARIFHTGEPVLSRVKETSGSEVDIRHGELALFEIGKIVSLKMFGEFHGLVTYDSSSKRQYNHNIPLGHLSFEVSNLGKKSYGLAHSPGRPWVVWPLWMVVSADDAISMQIRISIDLAKDEHPVTCEAVV
jgi:hypothetical protein